MHRYKKWLWFFGVLGVLSAVAIVTPIVYNLRIQLDPEELAAARQRWEEHGYEDYTLTLNEKENDDNWDRYVIQVRDGEVVEVIYDGKPQPLEGLSQARLQALTVRGLFDRIDRHLKENQESGKGRNFMRAQFKEKTGYPFHYVRRIRGTSERLEWVAEVTPR